MIEKGLKILMSLCAGLIIFGLTGIIATALTGISMIVWAVVYTIIACFLYKRLIQSEYKWSSDDENELFISATWPIVLIICLVILLALERLLPRRKK